MLGFPAANIQTCSGYRTRDTGFCLSFAPSGRKTTVASSHAVEWIEKRATTSRSARAVGLDAYSRQQASAEMDKDPPPPGQLPRVKVGAGTDMARLAGAIAAKVRMYPTVALDCPLESMTLAMKAVSLAQQYLNERDPFSLAVQFTLDATRNRRNATQLLISAIDEDRRQLREEFQRTGRELKSTGTGKSLSLSSVYGTQEEHPSHASPSSSTSCSPPSIKATSVEANHSLHSQLHVRMYIHRCSRTISSELGLTDDHVLVMNINMQSVAYGRPLDENIASHLSVSNKAVMVVHHQRRLRDTVAALLLARENMKSSRRAITVIPQLKKVDKDGVEKLQLHLLSFTSPWSQPLTLMNRHHVR